MRLDKFLCHAGVATRSAIKKVLKDHRVTVNDKITIQGKIQIEPSKDIIKLDNEIIKYKPYAYYVLYKPSGCVSANIDNIYPTVLDYFKNVKDLNLTHVGRLDLDTTGVILITNDGKLNHHLIDPNANITKVYNVTIDNGFKSSDIDDVNRGIVLENGEKCKSAKLEIINSHEAKIYLNEGKYHQVKRMMKALNHNVILLHREKFATLTLKNLKPGEFYELDEEEINELKAL